MSLSTPPALCKLAHLELSTPDLDRSLWFFEEVIGLDEVERRDGAVYLRAWGELDHHSLVLREGPGRLEHVGWRASAPGDVDAFAARLRAAGVSPEAVPAGHEAGQGEAIRFQTPSGHPFEIFFDVERPSAPEAIRSRLKSNSATALRRGMSPRRIDHVNLACRDVAAGEGWLREQLGFQLRELLRPTGRSTVGSWLAVTSQVHDIALTRDLGGADGTFHHVAFTLDSTAEVVRAAQVAAEHGLRVDAGPGMHGISQGVYLYLKDPGSGHRVELFAGGYQVFDPDWEPLEWTEKEYHTAFSWWGADYPVGGGPMDSTTPCAPAPVAAER